jgi:hypothetical protein
VSTEGIRGLYIETRNYGATAAFWASLGYESRFESDHGSGQWENPAGGPYVFIAERQEGELQMQPILHVADSTTFAPSRPVEYLRPFEPQHWGVVEALVRDPDGRAISLQAPVPEGVNGPDAATHHHEKYGD